MKKLIMLYMFIFWAGSSTFADDARPLPDEPEHGRDLSVSYQNADSYNQALEVWKTAEDIGRWVAASFKYDRARAIELSSNQRSRNKVISVYDPPELFARRAGVCVDLARFGFETLKKIDPPSQPKYLMIEFDPIQINGNTFRLHWLVSFKRDGKKYFFCDSKRPGYIAGPYNNTQEFINEYAQYRGRKIIKHRELVSYQKQKKIKARKTRATKRPGKANTAAK